MIWVPIYSSPLFISTQSEHFYDVITIPLYKLVDTEHHIIYIIFIICLINDGFDYPGYIRCMSCHKINKYFIKLM